LYHHIQKDLRLPLDGKLLVPFATFADARAKFPNDLRVALRGYAISEAARYANRLIGTPASGHSNVVMLFSRNDFALLKLRQQRFDFVMKLLNDGRLERRIARRLIGQGLLTERDMLGEMPL
jgi:hypothetical protein